MEFNIRNGFKLDDIVVQPLEGKISGSRGVAHVRPKVMDVLLCLADKVGEVVPREDLVESVWGHQFGADETLTRSISALRQHFGESTKNSGLLETIPKRGYRLVGSLQPLSTPSERAPGEPQSNIIDPATTQVSSSQEDENIGINARSVAVLPFVNVGNDPENEYFSDGMSDELLNMLGKQSDLYVAARTSSFVFKGQNEDIRAMGKRLNVETMVEGSVRTAGDRLRISAQLIGVKDGYKMWSETYDRELKDVFAIQEEIAENIADALKITLEPCCKVAAQQASTQNFEAYDYYLRGRDYFHRHGTRNIDFAVEMFNHAIEIDPSYAQAWAGLADSQAFQQMYFEPSEKRLEEASRASCKAVELAPDLPESHASRGLAHLLCDEFAQAEAEFEKAIKLNPRFFEAYYYYARTCFHQGKLEKAADLFKKAAEVRPEDYQAILLLGPIYKGLGDNEESLDASLRGLAVAEKHLKLHPDDARALYLGSGAWWDVGNKEKAYAWAERALEAGPNDPWTFYNLACFYSKVGDLEKALDSLDQANKNGICIPGAKSWYENDADLKPLKGHPRLKKIIEQLYTA
jgi:adenylate cyclase